MEPASAVRKTERDAHKWREGAREPHTEDSFILSQIFLPLLCVLFCFPCTETIGLSSNTSLCPPRRHLVALEWRRATISGRHRHGRYGFMAAGTSRILGGKTRDEPLMRARPPHPGRNACKWYAHSQRSLGGRRPSSRWAQRKMSGSGQKMTSKRLLHLFLYLSYFISFHPSKKCKVMNALQFSDDSGAGDVCEPAECCC